MNPDIARLFCLRDDLVHLNHASYGAPTRSMLDAVEARRRELETDTATLLGEDLREQLLTSATAVTQRLGLTGGTTAVVANATSASAALASSLCRPGSARVVMLDLEYESVLAGWRRAAEAVGGTLTVVPTTLPVADAGRVVELLDDVSGPVDTVVVSAVTSSSALALPLPAILDWAAGLGAEVVVDAAQGGLQRPLAAEASRAAAVFGSLHKWLPVPRPVGFLWVRDDIAARVAPAETSLSSGEGDLLRRFAWRGTWDPAPSLCLPQAFAEWDGWDRSGWLTSAEQLSTSTSHALVEQGWSPTGGDALTPPRLRAFLAPPGVSLDALRAGLARGHVRAWTGAVAGRAVLRVATHVYNDDGDVERLCEALP